MFYFALLLEQNGEFCSNNSVLGVHFFESENFKNRHFYKVFCLVFYLLSSKNLPSLFIIFCLCSMRE